MSAFDEEVWYRDPIKLVEVSGPGSFALSDKGSKAHNINVLTRIIIIATALTLLISPSAALSGMLIAGTMLILFVVVVSEGHDMYYEERFNQSGSTLLDGKVCTKPTENNPYMNRLPGQDLATFKECDPTDPEVAAAVDVAMMKQFDIDPKNPAHFSRYKHLSRTFYTVPNPSGVSDRDRVATYLLTGEDPKDADVTVVPSKGIYV